MTQPYQTKSSLLRPYFRCFWPTFWPNLIFFQFFQVLPPHPTTTLVWGIQEHLSHELKLFFCLVMLQDQCVWLTIRHTTLSISPCLLYGALYVIFLDTVCKEYAEGRCSHWTYLPTRTLCYALSSCSSKELSGSLSGYKGGEVYKNKTLWKTKILWLLFFSVTGMQIEP